MTTNVVPINGPAGVSLQERISSNVKAAAARRDLKLHDIAAVLPGQNGKIGVHYSQVTRRYQGKPWTTEDLEAVAKLMRVPVDVLLGYAPDPGPGASWATTQYADKRSQRRQVATLLRSVTRERVPLAA